MKRKQTSSKSTSFVLAAALASASVGPTGARYRNMDSDSDSTEVLCACDWSGTETLSAMEPLSVRFQSLAKRWRKETGMHSMAHLKYLHPAYQSIIGMGKSAIPLILAEMKSRPGHWAWALQHIAQEDPVREGANPKQACEDWLNWGIENGYA